MKNSWAPAPAVPSVKHSITYTSPLSCSLQRPCRPSSLSESLRISKKCPFLQLVYLDIVQSGELCPQERRKWDFHGPGGEHTWQHTTWAQVLKTCLLSLTLGPSPCQQQQQHILGYLYPFPGKEKQGWISVGMSQASVGRRKKPQGMLRS